MKQLSLFEEQIGDLIVDKTTEKPKNKNIKGAI